ncbi:hypothetical protein HZA96_07170 [Candidatus Woesearchaeota archaeon]|nr:hypothetical protein [Candidatus Woesearchaeota archaeon]
MAVGTSILVNEGLMGMLAGALVAVLIIGVIFYVFFALALMAIAKKTKTENAWLAWIPIANIYLMTQVAKVSGWYTTGLLLVFVPIIGSIAIAALFCYLWWKIAEARNRPGWWGILIGLVPIVNLVMIGMLAWSDN